MWPRSRPCWRSRPEINALPLTDFHRGFQALELHFRHAAVRAQGVKTQLDILHPGNFGLLEGQVQIFAPIRQQHDALGAFLGEQRQGKLERPGDIGAGRDRHRSQPGQALVGTANRSTSASLPNTTTAALSPAGI